MNSFAIKHKIDNVFALAKECGFELRDTGNGYTSGEIYLYAAPENTVFAQSICLERFASWEIAEAFFVGYLKCELAFCAREQKAEPVESLPTLQQAEPVTHKPATDADNGQSMSQADSGNPSY